MVTDSQMGWGGGQVSRLRANLLPGNQAQQMVNADLRDEEDIVTRRGTDQMSTETAGTVGTDRVLGAAYFDIVGTEKLVRVKRDSTTRTVETHDGAPASAWATAAGYTPADAEICIVQGNDKLFFGNGTDNLRSWDGATFTDLGTGYPAPPKYSVLVHFTNRLIGAGAAANPDTLGFSDILDETAWSLANTIRVGAGDGDPILALLPWTKTLLLVIKRSSMWVVNCDPATPVASMTVDIVSSEVGGVSARAAVRVQSDVWILTDYGVRSASRLLQGEDAAVNPALSWPVQNLFNAINRDAIDTSCMAFFDDRVLIAVPTGTSSYPDSVIVARIRPDGTACWLGQWTGWNPVQFFRSYIGGAERFYLAQSDGRVLRWRNFIRVEDEANSDFDDIAADVPTTLLTRALTFGEGRNHKVGFDVELEFNESRSTAVVVTPVLDGLEQSALATITSALGAVILPLTLPMTMPTTGIKRTPITLMHLAPFRELAFKITSAAGQVSLRSITATAQISYMHR